MVETTDSEKLSQKIIEKNKQLIDEAEQLLVESDNFLSNNNLKRGAATAFVSTKGASGEVAKVREEISRLDEEIEQQIHEEQQRVKGSSRSTKPATMRPGRVMI